MGQEDRDMEDRRSICKQADEVRRSAERDFRAGKPMEAYSGYGFAAQFYSLAEDSKGLAEMREQQAALYHAKGEKRSAAQFLGYAADTWERLGDSLAKGENRGEFKAAYRRAIEDFDSALAEDFTYRPTFSAITGGVLERKARLEEKISQL